MITGKNLFKMVNGTLKPDGDAEKIKNDLKEKYPHAEFTDDPQMMYYSITPKVKEGIPMCMYCGTPLKDMTKFKLVRGKWVPRKTKGTQRQQVCFNCSPKLSQAVTICVSYAER